MNISVCITTLNEEGSVGPLLDSLLNQSKKPDQIIFVDGGSSDKTVEIIRHYQQKDGRVKLLVEPCSRSRGRNLACEIAKNEIIAMTDAGCVADKNWVKNITAPFEKTDVDVVAGFYLMKGGTPFQKAESVYLGVLPKDFDVGFLPSTRSIAFRKYIWEKVGGFPEDLKTTAEDTVFNYKLIKAKAKFSRMKNAIVEWGMPETISTFQLAIYSYAKGDAKSKIWNFPGKGITSHNIKALFVILRYLVGFLFLILSLFQTSLFVLLLICIFAYFIWAYRKVYLSFGEIATAFWGPILQVVSDIAVMRGFVEGLIK